MYFKMITKNLPLNIDNHAKYEKIHHTTYERIQPFSFYINRTFLTNSISILHHGS